MRMLQAVPRFQIQPRRTRRRRKCRDKAVYLYPRPSDYNANITCDTDRSLASKSKVRSVTALTPGQLARKRDVDREAQRTIRRRVKEHIADLERQIEKLSNETSEQDSEDLSRLRQRNRELEMEKTRLLMELSTNQASGSMHSAPLPALVASENTVDYIPHQLDPTTVLMPPDSLGLTNGLDTSSLGWVSPWDMHPQIPYSEAYNSSFQHFPDEDGGSSQKRKYIYSSVSTTSPYWFRLILNIRGWVNHSDTWLLRMVV